MVFGVDDALMLAGTGASIYGSIMGGNNQQKGLNNQVALAQAQINEQAMENFMNRYYAQKADGENKLGTTTASGSRSHFVPGKGWVTDLAPMDKSLLDSSQTEQFKRNTIDAPIARELMQRNYGRQLDQGNEADELLREIRQGPSTTQSQLESQYRDRASKNVGKGFDQATADVSRVGLRTGADTSNQMAKIARQRSDALSTSDFDATQQADQAFQQSEGNRTNQLGSLYDQFVTKAGGAPGNTFTPFDTSTSDNLANSGAGKSSQLAALMGKSVNPFSGVKLPTGEDYNQVYGANGYGPIGDLLSGGASSLYKMFQNRNAQSDSWTSPTSSNMPAGLYNRS